MRIDNIDIDDYELVDIVSVCKSENRIKMNDIQVEDNATFVLENGILTHNSAIASFTEIRNPEIQAGMPLRGKILNVYGKAPIDAMENAEVADIVTALNLEFNEQQGDWIIEKDARIFYVKYESIFEVDKEGNSIIKEAIVSEKDRFHINKRWVPIGDLFDHQDAYWGYIDEIKDVTSEKKITDLTDPDYFHFRRLWDYRGFRKDGVKYEVKIGREKFICNDIDEICYDKKNWKKVTNLLKNTPSGIEINKVSQSSELTRYHKFVKPVFDTKLNYSQAHIATDADPDGSAINNLFVNLIHEYFPELLWNKERPFLSRIMFPMIAATKGKKTEYFANRGLFEKSKESGKIDSSWKVTYFKGLGSMEKKDWQYVFDNLDTYAFGIYDDGHIDELIQIFFDSDADIRKEWLSIK